MTLYNFSTHTADFIQVYSISTENFRVMQILDIMFEVHLKYP